jgi:replicative DNA helicase
LPQAEARDLTRSLPSSNEAERSLLGSMLLPNSRETISKVIDSLGDNPDYFYRDAHKTIFRTILDMFQEEVEVDTVTLAEKLENQDKLDDIGGASYLAELVDSVPSAAHVDHYAEIVEQKYTHRSLIETCEDIIQRSYREEKTPDELLDQAEQRIFSVKEEQISDGLTPITDDMEETFDILQEAAEREDTIAGISTGFSEMDEKTSGMQASQLNIIAARPGMGKTSFALTLAQNAALEEDEPVAVFSLEMSKRTLVKRMLASVSEVSFEKLRDGELSDRDWHKVTNAMTRLNNSPIFLNDNANMDVLEMKGQARRLRAEHGLSLLLVDYLQLMEPVDSSIPREQQLAHISRGLKQLAMELDIPVMALTQLNREVERRGGDKRPQLSDLRGTGAIEQDADLVAFIYRQHYYTQKEEHKGIADIIIGKQRNGPTGTIQLHWHDDYMSFTELDTGREPDF